VLPLHAHRPGVTVSLDAIERVLRSARDRGLAFLTFPELDAGNLPRSGLALAFDDRWVDEWFATRDLFARYGARVTFFVSQWHQLTPEHLNQLELLAMAGHALEPHGVAHANAVDYVRDHGIDEYLAGEVLPSIEAIVGAGFRPTTFAYPFGVHDESIDEAVLAYLPRVRTAGRGCPW
jgi:peptidoglycan-N-acetylglucosamine deacetylase